DGFLEFGTAQLVDQRHGFFNGVGLVALYFVGDQLCLFGQLGHYTTPSVSIPALRAVPAMVRTAASRSAAVRSGCFVFAISSSCARVSLPPVSVLGRAEPLCTPAAFLLRTLAGGVLVMKVKLLSA